MTPEDKLALELRNEIQARVGQWKAEREQLQKATERIIELDALIAFAEDETKMQFRVAPRPQRFDAAPDTGTATDREGRSVNIQEGRLQP